MHVLLEHEVVLALPDPDISLLHRGSIRELVHGGAVLRQKSCGTLLSYLEHAGVTWWYAGEVRGGLQRSNIVIVRGDLVIGRILASKLARCVHSIFFVIFF